MAAAAAGVSAAAAAGDVKAVAAAADPAAAAEAVRVYVVSHVGRSVAYDVQPHMTVLQLKFYVQDREGIPPPGQLLIWKSTKALEPDTALLGSFGLCDGDRIALHLRTVRAPARAVDAAEARGGDKAQAAAAAANRGVMEQDGNAFTLVPVWDRDMGDGQWARFDDADTATLERAHDTEPSAMVSGGEDFVDFRTLRCTNITTRFRCAVRRRCLTPAADAAERRVTNANANAAGNDDDSDADADANAPAAAAAGAAAAGGAAAAAGAGGGAGGVAAVAPAAAPPAPPAAATAAPAAAAGAVAAAAAPGPQAAAAAAVAAAAAAPAVQSDATATVTASAVSREARLRAALRSRAHNGPSATLAAASFAGALTSRPVGLTGQLYPVARWGVWYAPGANAGITPLARANTYQRKVYLLNADDSAQIERLFLAVPCGSIPQSDLDWAFARTASSTATLQLSVPLQLERDCRRAHVPLQPLSAPKQWTLKFAYPPTATNAMGEVLSLVRFTLSVDRYCALSDAMRHALHTLHADLKPLPPPTSHDQQMDHLLQGDLRDDTSSQDKSLCAPVGAWTALKALAPLDAAWRRTLSAPDCNAVLSEQFGLILQLIKDVGGAVEESDALALTLNERLNAAAGGAPKSATGTSGTGTLESVIRHAGQHHVAALHLCFWLTRLVGAHMPPALENNIRAFLTRALPADEMPYEFVMLPVHSNQPVPAGDAAAAQAAQQRQQALSVLVNAREAGVAGRTPLMHACMRSQCSVAEVLLLFGAYVDTRDNFDTTALTYAAKEGSIDCADLLLRHRCDVSTVDRDGRTALLWACWSGTASLVRLLVRYRARTDAVDWFGRGLAYYLQHITASKTRLAVVKGLVAELLESLAALPWEVADEAVEYVALDFAPSEPALTGFQIVAHAQLSRS